MDMDENLEKLKKLVDESFLDKNLRCSVKFNEETLEEEKKEYVRLKSILDLKLSEEEEFFIIDYLGSLGIFVRGRSSYYSGICDNYKQTDSLNRNTVKKLTEEEQQKYLEEYQTTKDIIIRNRVVESNIPLVKCLSKKYSYLYDTEQEFLESYGYEGLINALDSYDASRGKIGPHLSWKVQDYIFRAIAISNLGEDGKAFLSSVGKKKSADTKYLEYFYTKAKVEKQKEEKLKDNLELIEVIAHQLKKNGYCRGEDLEELKTRVFANNPYSYEQIEEDLWYLDDDTLSAEVIENVYQQELAEFIEDITDDLPEKNKEALRSYYGLGGRESNSLRSAGKTEGVTYETIRLRCKKGKEILKNMMTSWCWQRSSITKSFLENSNHEYENNVCSVYMKRK